MTTLREIAYFEVIRTNNFSVSHAVIGNQYGFIEKDSTITSLGKLLDIQYSSGGNWHDGYITNCVLHFENKSEPRYIISKSSYHGESGMIIPIICLLE